MRTPRLRHKPRLRFERLRRWSAVIDFLAERATALGATGASDTFTADVQAATGVLTLAGNAVANETVTIGSTVYTFKAIIEAEKAVGVLTLAGQPLNTETVTIGAKVYTFQTVLTNVDGNVFIGAAATDSIDNLIAAITLGAGSGTLYAAATTAHPTATAAVGAGDTMNVEALAAGTAGNAIATTETLTNGSFGAATLAGGAAAEAAFAVEIGATASDTIDNLIAAINLSAGAGTLYGTGTTVHPTVSAAVGAGDTMGLTAKTAGSAGSSIATTETMTNGSFAGATLAGGVTSNSLEAVAHGFLTGAGPFYLTTSSALPGGLVEDVLYFVKKIDADNFELCTDVQCSLSSEITSDGVGTHTMTKAADAAAVLATLKKHPAVVVANATDIDSL